MRKLKQPLLLTLFLTSAQFAAGATIWVANNGLDTSTCGADTAPCRSISQGIVRAAALDTVMVAPGRYGDLDMNNVVGESGEENGNGVCNCLIYINKQITVRSQKGAAVTFIEAPSWWQGPKVVLAAAGAKFGVNGGGFFVKATQGIGVQVDATNARVDGNVLQGGSTGIQVNANSGVFTYNHVRFMSGDGIRLSVSGSVTNNVAASNGGSGFRSSGNSAGFIANQALSNGLHGFLAEGASNSFSSNIAVANQSAGIQVAATATSVTLNTNTLSGNNGVGLRVLAAPSSINAGNIYGNGTVANACQFENGTAASINAANIFWGGGLPAGALCGNPVNTAPVANSEWIAAYPNVFGQVIVGLNGSDLAGCGTVNGPCRTIPFAITQAPVGGTILVKPGRYSAAATILVNKNGLGVKAHGGDGAVVINGSATTLVEVTGATAGIQGLTLVGTNNAVGVRLAQTQAFARQNLFLRSRASLAAGAVTLQYNSFGEGGVQWSGAGTPGNVTDNQVFGGAIGFDFTAVGAVPRAPDVFQRNTAAGTTGTAGFVFVSGQASAANTLSTGNYSVGNVRGLSLNVTVTGTNSFYGFHVLGNRFVGVTANQNVTAFNNANLFGNGEVPDIYPPGCGTYVYGTAAAAQNFSNNYWGVSTGPGNLNPADASCKDAAAVTPLVTPVRTVPVAY